LFSKKEKMVGKVNHVVYYFTPGNQNNSCISSHHPEKKAGWGGEQKDVGRQDLRDAAHPRADNQQTAGRCEKQGDWRVR